MASRVNDGQWLRHAFLLPLRETRTVQVENGETRYATSAAYKFTNTSLGGNYAINNPPQYTPLADIRIPGRGRGEEERHLGMGRYYSEAIDDQRQVVHMRFGVPRFNSLVNFFTNFYDSYTAQLANTGRTNAAFYNLGLLSGYVVSLPLQPFIMAGAGIKRVLQFLSDTVPSKWYYFKPTMHTYWSTVNVLANEFAIGLGLTPRAASDDQDKLEDPGSRVTTADLKRMHDVFPDLFRRDGGVDVMALANRTQRMDDASQEALAQRREMAQNIGDLRDKTLNFLKQKAKDPNPDANTRDYFFKAIKSPEGQVGKNGVGTESFSSWKDLSVSGMADFFRASQRDGSQFASFRVNANGSMSESFNNATRDSDLQQTLNTKVEQGRMANFNLMGGNIIGGMEPVLDAFKSWISGALDSVHLGGLATLAGSAFIDMPKIWDGSTAQLPRADYTIPLYSPYGNPISRFQNLYIPIAMALAGALPLAAGRSAYTSPFICQIFHEGRVQCQLGMIDSMTLTRGNGNVGWNNNNDMLGAEITFSVVDMSNLIHLPIKGGFASPNWAATALSAGAITAAEAVAGETGAGIATALTNSAVWDEYSTYSDYMSVLTGMSAADTFYRGQRLNLNIARTLANFRTWRSPSNLMAAFLDTGPARSISAMAQYTNRF